MDRSRATAGGALALGAALAAAAAGAAAAQPAAEPPAAWTAVGRLTYGAAHRPGAALCTATLIAPDLALTAGHCVRRGDGAPMAAPTVRIAFGGAAPARGVAILGPDGGPAADRPPADLAGDLALVRLAAPVAGVAPLRLAGADPGQPPWTRVAFRRDAPGVAEAAPCRPVALSSPVIGLDCAAVSGQSGAPLLVERDGAWRIVGVMVARNRDGGPVRSLAVVPPAPPP